MCGIADSSNKSRDAVPYLTKAQILTIRADKERLLSGEVSPHQVLPGDNGGVSERQDYVEVARKRLDV